MPAPNFDVIASLAKRRGFVFPSSEIYGGMAGFWDCGPLGVELKNNVKAAWWRHMVHAARRRGRHRRRDHHEPAGLGGVRPRRRLQRPDGRLPQLQAPLPRRRPEGPADRRSPVRTAAMRGTLTEPRQFNLMFATHVGPVADRASVAYLRPETAQAMFVQFDNVATSMRRKLPFGIAQMGRSFRNEITPGNFIFRLREFEQMEMEFFVHPRDEDEWFTPLGRRTPPLVDRCHRHRRRAAAPAPARRRRAEPLLEADHRHRVRVPDRLVGARGRRRPDRLRPEGARRGERARSSRYFDEASGEHIVPYVIEPAMGVERAVLTALVDGYAEEQLAKETRVVLRLRPRAGAGQGGGAAAPAQPTRARRARAQADGRPEAARRRRCTTTPRRSASSTAARTRSARRSASRSTSRSLDDGAATIRERDSMTQERVALDLVPQRVADLVAGARGPGRACRARQAPRMTTAGRCATRSLRSCATHDAAFARGRRGAYRAPLRRDARLLLLHSEAHRRPRGGRGALALASSPSSTRRPGTTDRRSWWRSTAITPTRSGRTPRRSSRVGDGRAHLVNGRLVHVPPRGSDGAGGSRCR